ncbi:TnsD family Tn7-like transposition protein [Pseudomonas abietaniphila]
MDESDALLRWYDDETFFSLCCRQHLFLGHADTASTLEWLYGSEQPTTHDFPSNIGSLNNRMIAAWGDSKSIIFERTILPFFVPFQSQTRINVAVDAMESKAIGSLKYSLGLLTGRFGAEHPLKSCSICMSTDRATNGVAYWHLNHQYPGVVLCPVHDVLLKECTANRQWSGRFEWALPSEDLFAPSSLSDPEDTAIQVLRQMGQAVVDLASYGKTRVLDPMVVYGVYKAAAGSTNQIELASSLTYQTSLLQPYPPYGNLPTNKVDAEKFLTQLLRKPRGRQHPLKHLLLITCLFGQFSSFIKAYERLSEQIRAEKSITKIALPSAHKSKRAAKEPQASRRPKKLKPNIRADILENLKIGKSKRQVCSKFGISITTVNRLLVSEPELKETREKSFRAAQLAEYRAAWIDALRAGPATTPKQLRAKMPSVYAWLYRNDRSWLLDQNSKLPSGRRGNYSHVDWEMRDRNLHELIVSTVKRVHGSYENRGITRAIIFSLIPNLSRLLEKRTRYPRSRQLLAGLLKRLKA